MTINHAWAAERPHGGMIPRKQEVLKGPLSLARIGHSLSKGKPASHEQNLGSPWWISSGSMEYLWTLSRASGTPLATIVRQKCCIPNYWDSSCDLIYEVVLTGYVSSWIGPGTFFFPEKDSSQTASPSLWPESDVVFYPAGEFPQIYIPGLWDDNVKFSAWHKRTVTKVSDFEKAASFFSPSRTAI